MKHVGITALWIALLATPFRSASATELREAVSAREGGTLRIELDAGSVEIETHDRSEVRIDASATGFAAGSVVFTLEGDGVDAELRGEQSGWLGVIGASRVRVRARVPRSYNVDVSTRGGSVEIEDLGGQARVRTSGGRIQIDGARDEVDLHTSGGEIRVEQIRGAVTAETSGGSIRVSDVEGRVDVHTSGGSIDVSEVSGPVRAGTSGGSVQVRFDGPPSGQIETSGGGIEVTFDGDAALDLDASTSGGRVEIDDDLRFKGNRERSSARGSINGGGAGLELRTSGGNVRVKGD